MLVKCNNPSPKQNKQVNSARIRNTYSQAKNATYSLIQRNRRFNHYGPSSTHNHNDSYHNDYSSQRRFSFNTQRIPKTQLFNVNSSISLQCRISNQIQEKTCKSSETDKLSDTTSIVKPSADVMNIRYHVNHAWKYHYKVLNNPSHVEKKGKKKNLLSYLTS